MEDPGTLLGGAYPWSMIRGNLVLTCILKLSPLQLHEEQTRGVECGCRWPQLKCHYGSRGDSRAELTILSDGDRKGRK